MNLSEIVDTVRSGVVHINYIKDKERVGSGTGFMVDGFLVTNYHVYSGPEDSVVLIRFHDSSQGYFILKSCLSVSSPKEHNRSACAMFLNIWSRYKFRVKLRAMAKI